MLYILHLNIHIIYDYSFISTYQILSFHVFQFVATALLCFYIVKIIGLLVSESILHPYNLASVTT